MGSARLLRRAMGRSARNSSRHVWLALVAGMTVLFTASCLAASLTPSKEQAVTALMGPGQTAVQFALVGDPAKDLVWDEVQQALSGRSFSADITSSTTVAGKRIWGGVSYQERSQVPLRLESGRAPRQVGEVVVSRELSRVLGGQSTLGLLIPQNSLRVVGVGRWTSAAKGASIAAYPGTYRSLDWDATSRSGGTLQALVTLGWDGDPSSSELLSAADPTRWGALDPQAGCLAEVCVTDRTTLLQRPRFNPTGWRRVGIGLLLAIFPSVLAALLVSTQAKALGRQGLILRALGVSAARMRLEVVLLTVRALLTAAVPGAALGISLAAALHHWWGERVTGTWVGGFVVPIEQIGVALGLATCLGILAALLFTKKATRPPKHAELAGGAKPARRKPERALLVAALAWFTWRSFGGTEHPTWMSIAAAMVATGALLVLVARRPFGRQNTILGRWQLGMWRRHSSRTIGATLALALAGGYAGYLLTAQNSMVAMAAAAFSGDAPAGTFVVATNGPMTPEPSDLDAVRHATGLTPTAWETPDFHLDGNEILAGGPLMAVNTAADAARIMRRELSDADARLLEAGGALAFTRTYGPAPRDLGMLAAVSFEDESKLGTLATRLVDTDPNIANASQGLVLASTVQRLGAKTEFGGALFEGDDAAVERARDALGALGRWDGIIQPHVPFTGPDLRVFVVTTLAVAALAVLLIAGGSLASVARVLRLDAVRLLAIGGSPRVAGRLLWLTSLRIVALGICGALAVAVLPLLGWEVSTPYRVIFVPIGAWTAYLAALVAIVMGLISVQARSLRVVEEWRQS